MTGIKHTPVRLLNLQLLHRLYGRTVEPRRSQFHKKQNRQYQVNRREHDGIHDGFESGKAGCESPTIYTDELDPVMKDAYNTIWTVYASSTTGTFKLGQNASFVINAPGSGAANLNGLYIRIGGAVIADAGGGYVIDVQALSNLAPDVDYAVIAINPATYLTTEIITRFYSITFDANGGTNDPSLPAPYYVLEGSTVSAPPNPVNGLKAFTGWFADTALTQSFGFGVTAIHSDTTIYAKWIFTRVVINETVLGPSGGAATGGDYVLAALDPVKKSGIYLYSVCTSLSDNAPVPPNTYICGAFKFFT